MNDFATTLKLAREALGLSLEEVARRTYIKAGFLEALEGHGTESLPAAVYTYGYIRQYAKLLNLDGGALVAQYQHQERMGGEARRSPVPPPPASPPPASPPQRSQAPMADLPGEPFNPFKAAFSPNGNGNGNGHHRNGNGAHGANGKPAFTALPGEPSDVTQAQARAQQIMSAAQSDAEQLVRGAERYADDVLATLEREIAQTLQTIQNGRQFLASRRAPGPYGSGT